MADEVPNSPTVLEVVQLFMGRIAMLEARLAAVEKMQSDDADDAGLQFWPSAPPAEVAPLTSVKLESGAAVTITNTYDAAVRRYLWVDIENRTGEWKLNTVAAFPDKVIIYDGSAGYGSELIITGH